jgi:hypothetical protein
MLYRPLSHVTFELQRSLPYEVRFLSFSFCLSLSLLHISRMNNACSIVFRTAVDKEDVEKSTV